MPLVTPLTTFTSVTSATQARACNKSIYFSNEAVQAERTGNYALAAELRVARRWFVLTIMCVFNCPGQMFALSELKTCGGCGAPNYCSVDCQKRDWKERHKVLCRKLKESSKKDT
ncbi:hypothetical protein HYALB_00012082 [Hymenoscyphus albidus]|uniref:MYND-type domain-containing protein n=1 Tax=Hymenoscyphus albidus TaxID=595503 RepID=A0A9N9LTV4_9HELO|nr:hypothetical protein HYALB_00012082 [Hymenoscyphus albidus]